MSSMFFSGLNLPFLFEVTKVELSHQSLKIHLRTTAVDK